MSTYLYISFERAGSLEEIQLMVYGRRLQSHWNLSPNQITVEHGDPNGKLTKRSIT